MPKELPVTTLGAKPHEGSLNVVMVRKHFASLADFHAHAESLLSHPAFSPEKPHVFVFAETPFPTDYVPPRKAVRAFLEGLPGLLKRHHPDSRLVFSVNETTSPGRGANKSDLPLHSNTGYVVSREGRKAYPKLNYQSTDAEPLRIPSVHYAEDVMPKPAVPRLDWELQIVTHPLERRWKRRAEKETARGHVFPTFDAGGHHLEFRVCADAMANFQHSPGPDGGITLVSADGMPTKMISRGSLTNRSFVFVNDHQSREGFGRRVFAKGRSGPFYLDEGNEAYHAELGKLLSRHGLRLHLVG